ncbi:RNA 2'-phosphotransferase [Rufibacter sediminis]|uniref:Probable RNA 2'-phosphotransferase n=1 Tax=Rufibacter sediminis TaxID=2762756 RepID=A0ABR6VNP7_9BACT|nr:RNA 2'-phosphotransferase [Rufibacter sediminis]MBC3538802.1 RNA 2'-phosphotransferase [Rufibacter sediminis]
MRNQEISKFLSLVLRHKPEALGIDLDAEGWADVEHLLHRMNASGRPMTLEKLEEVVETNDKHRFAFNEDHTRLRASQGHSIGVDLQLRPVEPPAVLYHGTTEGYLASIWKEGIQRRSRQYVHLSADVETATRVGARHGKPFVFVVKSGQMHQAGHHFYLSENQVWLTDAVPAIYLEEHRLS